MKEVHLREEREGSRPSRQTVTTIKGCVRHSSHLFWWWCDAPSVMMVMSSSRCSVSMAWSVSTEQQSDTPPTHPLPAVREGCGEGGRSEGGNSQNRKWQYTLYLNDTGSCFVDKNSLAFAVILLSCTILNIEEEKQGKPGNEGRCYRKLFCR